MAYDFTTRLDHVGSRMPQLHDNTMTYTRDGYTITFYNCTPEKVDVEQMQALGIAIIQEKWQDFVFDALLLETAFIPPEPQVGDIIGWQGYEFRVSVLGEETFRYTTSSRKRIRVHTRQVT
jgi:hypothetical protein